MDILFWSGGKDSYLALEFYRKEYDSRKLKLLTTFDEKTGVVPHQNIPIEKIAEQSSYLDLELIKVPLPPGCPNKIYLEKVLLALKSEDSDIERLIFGDWKLDDIREWREKEFGEEGYRCVFPIWMKSLHDLLPVLILKPVDIRISAVQDEYKQYIRVGERYDQAFVRSLPKEINPMGENGEFHTIVKLIDLKDKVI